MELKPIGFVPAIRGRGSVCYIMPTRLLFNNIAESLGKTHLPLYELMHE
jgi:hypothetical protein